MNNIEVEWPSLDCQCNQANNCVCPTEERALRAWAYNNGNGAWMILIKLKDTTGKTLKLRTTDPWQTAY